MTTSKIFFEDLSIKNHCLGEKQKIISFSFYGDLKSKYYDGVASNLDYLDVSF